MLLFSNKKSLLYTHSQNWSRMYEIWKTIEKDIWGKYFVGKVAIDNWVFKLHYMAS